jgi:hypothetical protein
MAVLRIVPGNDANTMPYQFVNWLIYYVIPEVWPFLLQT